MQLTQHDEKRTHRFLENRKLITFRILSTTNAWYKKFFKLVKSKSKVVNFGAHFARKICFHRYRAWAYFSLVWRISYTRHLLSTKGKKFSISCCQKPAIINDFLQPRIYLYRIKLRKVVFGTPYWRYASFREIPIYFTHSHHRLKDLNFRMNTPCQNSSLIRLTPPLLKLTVAKPTKMNLSSKIKGIFGRVRYTLFL